MAPFHSGVCSQTASWSAVTSTAIRRSATLARAFQTRLLADLEVFRFTATLDDTPPVESVEALERLGKLTVFVGWPRMNRLLNKAAECRSQPKTGATEDDQPGARQLSFWVAVIGSDEAKRGGTVHLPPFSDPGACNLKLASLLHRRPSAI